MSKTSLIPETIGHASKLARIHSIGRVLKSRCISNQPCSRRFSSPIAAKTAGRQLARRAEVPTVPGTNDPIEDPQHAQELARNMGYPVLLKAVAGGGGKGMRVVNSDSEFSSAFRDASSEALNAFGDASVYLEKYLDKPRHIEIQILADHHGRVVSLGERECSLQRRHQKVIEEAPSPIVTPELRKRMGDAAVRLARVGGYTNAGTVEFLVDAHYDFY